MLTLQISRGLLPSLSFWEGWEVLLNGFGVYCHPMGILRRATLLIAISAGLAFPLGAQENTQLRAGAIRVLSCITQPDAPIRLDAQYSAADGFRVQYARNTMRFPIGNGQFETQQTLAVVVYGREGRTAYFYKVAMEVPESLGRIGLWNAFYLEKQNQQWQIIEVWQGGESVYREEQATLPGLLQMTIRTIPRTEVRPPAQPCWTPNEGSGYGLRLGRAGTAFRGPRIKEQSGPYNNSFGGGAPKTVWITFWQD